MLVLANNLEAIIHKILHEPIVILGFAGQSFFFIRFLIQWIVSEKQGKSVIPIVFWYISLAGALIVFTYGFIVSEPILVVGQLASSFVYIRNLVLIYTNKNKISRAHLQKTQSNLRTTNVRSAEEILAKIKEFEAEGKKQQAQALRFALKPDN